MNLYRSCVRPLLFRFDPEWVHHRAIGLAAAAARLPTVRNLVDLHYRVHDARLGMQLGSLRFENPIGLAAGFDKNGQAIQMLQALGFGFVEIGSVSADPSAGNPRPRLFRLVDDEAIVVNYGVPNDGAEVVSQRMARVRPGVPVGINLVETNSGVPATLDDVIGQFLRATQVFLDRASYFSLNLNCPNSGHGQSLLNEPANLTRLLEALGTLQSLPPVFLKVMATDDPATIEATLGAAGPHPIVAGICLNLPPGKPYRLKASSATLAKMPGAVSGRPTRDFMKKALRAWYSRAERHRFHFIGGGGIFDAHDAYDAIRSGASLVQLYSALVFEGPGVVRAINRGLRSLLDRDGLRTLGDAVGVACREEAIART